MKNEFNLAFAGLKLGKHLFEFEISSKFFDFFEVEQEFEQPNLTATVVLNKLSNHLELDLRTAGVLTVHCDISNEPFEMEVAGEAKLVVNFGHEENKDDDEIWVILMNDHQVDIRQWVYETILLSIPIKRIDPAVLENKNSGYIALLEKYQPKEKEENRDDSDPRWDALKNLDLEN